MISKIAILRALQLGDLLCIIPSVRAIRACWPDAEIFLVGLPWQQDFAKRFNRYFNRFIEFPGWPGLPEQQPDTEKIIQFLKEMRQHHFDLVLQMQGNGDLTNSLCMLWGAHTVSGLRKSHGYAPDASLFPVSEDGEHEITRFFKLLRCLGIPEQGSMLEFPIRTEEDELAKKYITQTGILPGQYVCIHPGARDPRRRWPIGHFTFVANALAANGTPILLTGSSDESELISQLYKQTRGRAINTVEEFGHVSAGVLASMLKYSRLLISNDTGVSHIAAALKIPSVVIFSPYSDINRWRPLDAELHESIPHSLATDPGYVLETAQKLLQRISSPLYGEQPVIQQKV